VGAALIWTLERVLGAGFTGEMADAWSTAYGVLADVMKEGMTDALPARAL
jgi:nitric oxide dioxygenase